MDKSELYTKQAEYLRESAKGWQSQADGLPEGSDRKLAQKIAAEYIRQASELEAKANEVKVRDAA